jgi:hypothetical protein
LACQDGSQRFASSFLDIQCCTAKIRPAQCGSSSHRACCRLPLAGTLCPLAGRPAAAGSKRKRTGWLADGAARDQIGRCLGLIFLLGRFHAWGRRACPRELGWERPVARAGEVDCAAGALEPDLATGEFGVAETELGAAEVDLAAGELSAMANDQGNGRALPLGARCDGHALRRGVDLPAACGQGAGQIGRPLTAPCTGILAGDP